MPIRPKAHGIFPASTAAIVAALSLVLLLPGGTHGPAAAAAAAPLNQTDVLRELYEATAGPSWLSSRNWTSTPNPCLWEWVSCTSGGAVRKLKLEFNNMNGTLPNSIGSLDALGGAVTYLSVHHNALQGTLPPSIASLVGLKTLYASDNSFSGTLPPAYGSLRKLGRLFLSSNYLHGTVPVSYGSLKNLYRAMFSDNDDLRGSSLPSGELPPSFRSLERLINLNGPLARNQFWPRDMPALAATAHNNVTPTYYAGACACGWTWMADGACLKCWQRRRHLRERGWVVVACFVMWGG
jgi:hypothetical protein